MSAVTRSALFAPRSTHDPRPAPRLSAGVRAGATGAAALAGPPAHPVQRPDHADDLRWHRAARDHRVAQHRARPPGLDHHRDRPGLLGVRRGLGRRPGGADRGADAPQPARQPAQPGRVRLRRGRHAHPADRAARAGRPAAHDLRRAGRGVGPDGGRLDPGAGPDDPDRQHDVGGAEPVLPGARGRRAGRRPGAARRPAGAPGHRHHGDHRQRGRADRLAAAGAAGRRRPAGLAAPLHLRRLHRGGGVDGAGRAGPGAAGGGTGLAAGDHPGQRAAVRAGARLCRGARAPDAGRAADRLPDGPRRAGHDRRGLRPAADRAAPERRVERQPRGGTGPLRA